MAADSSYPQVPSNYVTIHDLRERWMKKRQQEELEKEQQPKHEPTLSQPRQRNHVRRGKKTSSAAAIAPPGNQTGLAMAATQAEESRVSGVEEQSALVAVEETVATKSKRQKPKSKKNKKKFGIDGEGKARLNEDADGSVEHAPAGNVAGESVPSTDLLKGDTFKVEVKCISTESKVMRQVQPKIKRHTHVRARKVAGESISIEKKVSKIDLGRVNDGLDTESLPKIKNADPANPTFKMEDKFKKLSMQDDRRGYQGGGRGHIRGSGRPSLYSGGEMVWVKKVEKADDNHSGSSSKLLN